MRALVYLFCAHETQGKDDLHDLNKLMPLLTVSCKTQNYAKSHKQHKRTQKSHKTTQKLAQRTKKSHKEPQKATKSHKEPQNAKIKCQNVTNTATCHNYRNIVTNTATLSQILQYMHIFLWFS